MTRFVSAFLMSVALFTTSAFAGSVALKITGMTCGGCEGKVKRAVAGVDGATLKSVSAKDGMAHVSFDASKCDKAAIVKAINATGLKAVGEEVTFKVSGMSCVSCEGKIKKALAAVEGVEVKSVSKSDEKAVVVTIAKGSEWSATAASNPARPSAIFRLSTKYAWALMPRARAWRTNASIGAVSPLKSNAR